MPMLPSWRALITPVVQSMSDRLIQHMLLFFTVLTVSACTLVGRPALLTGAGQHGPWQTTIRDDHPLVGRIWQQGSATFISSQALTDRLGRHNIVLLGEKHDNPDHHRLRLVLLQHLLGHQYSGQRQPGVLAMEMLSADQQALIDAVDRKFPPDADILHEQLNWDDGWHWPFYQPVLELALTTPGLQLRSANITREQVMDVYGGDLNDNTAAAIDRALNETQLAALSEDIDISHCGLLPDSQFEAMVRVQQVRDHIMAQALAPASGPAAANSGLRILLAGNYHVRHDTGVPNYLPDTETRPITVAFLEVEEGQYNPQDYQRLIDNIAAWDYIWFTPALTDEDYCERMAGGT